MKKINYILGVLALSAAMTSCVWDLKVTPIDPNANTADKALVNEAAFEQFLSGVYLGFATSGYYGANGDASISSENRRRRGTSADSEIATLVDTSVSAKSAIGSVPTSTANAIAAEASTRIATTMGVIFIG